MNVDIVNGSTARWWVVVVLSVALFAMVIATWRLMKSSRVSKPTPHGFSIARICYWWRERAVQGLVWKSWWCRKVNRTSKDWLGENLEKEAPWWCGIRNRNGSWTPGQSVETKTPLNKSGFSFFCFLLVSSCQIMWPFDSFPRYVGCLSYLSNTFILLREKYPNYLSAPTHGNVVIGRNVT